MARLVAAAAAAVLLLAAWAACTAAAPVQVPKCEWASEYWLCVATRAAAWPRKPAPPNRLATKDLQTWARESLCAAQNTKALCDKAAVPGKNVGTSGTTDPCFWDAEQKFCRTHVNTIVDIACEGDLAQLTDKCSAFDKQASCVTNSLCKWGKINNNEICYPRLVDQLGIKTIPAYYINYYYNPATYGTCDESKTYRNFLSKCWGKSKDACQSSKICKYWPNEAACTSTEAAEAAYVTGGDTGSISAENYCGKFYTREACGKAGTVAFDPKVTRKYLEDNVPKAFAG